MITGTVTPYREAVIRIKLRDSVGIEAEIEAVVDTGFTDYLTLPASAIGSLTLAHGGTIRAALADGSAVDLDVYTIEIEWHSQWRMITVLEADGGPLVGMSLLYGNDLAIRIVDGGNVSIVPVP